MNTPRIEYGMPQDDYRASEGLSHTESKDLRKSPHHMHAKRERPDDVPPKAPSPQMFAGTLTHCAILEPHLFDQRYVIGPDVSKNSNVWKAFVAECDANGSEPITQLQRKQAFGQAATLRALPDFAPLLDNSACEVSMWWRCSQTGVLCKARPDLVRLYPPPAVPVLAESDDPAHKLRAQLIAERGFAILGDVKSTESADAESFARSVADYSYHTQAHWYIQAAEACLGVPVLSFLFAVVEREYPYAAASYTLDDAAMQVAADINIAARRLYAQCDSTGNWPGYPRETRDISLPRWYMKRYVEGLPV